MITTIAACLGVLFGWWLRWWAAGYWNKRGWAQGTSRWTEPLDKVGK